MPKLKHAVPKYRKHRASGQAIVTIAGRDRYLGPHGTKASKREYDRLIGEWLAAGRPSHVGGPDELTVVEVLARYWTWAKKHYRKDGKPTGEVDWMRDVIRRLKQRYGHTRAAYFGPLALKAFQQQLIDDGLSRPGVNARVNRVKRIFRWAASEELIPASVPQALSTVAALRKGRCEAPESKPVQPVDDDVVDATLPHLPPILANMVRLQRLTGMRPGEVCIVRPCDVDRSGEVWTYTPESHKTEHHGRQRIIHVGPKAQAILMPYLLRPADSFCFSPGESERRRRALAHEARTTPMSCGNKPGSNRRRKPKRQAGSRYNPVSYRKAIHRACDRAEVARWSPGRLRHTAATAIRSRFGLEAAQITLGHARADVTQIYAERDLSKAAAIMREAG